MTAKTDERQEFISCLGNATPDTIDLLMKLFVLGTLDGFGEAVVEATPPGQDAPPLPVLRKLVDEWAERKGL